MVAYTKQELEVMEERRKGLIDYALDTNNKELFNDMTGRQWKANINKRYTPVKVLLDSVSRIKY